MTKWTIIPKGYRLTVSSSENDSDNHKERVKAGLSAKELSYCLDVCKLLSEGFGNMYEPDDSEMEEYFEAQNRVATAHGNMLDIDDLIYDLFGTSEHYTTRQLEDFKVEWIPEDIFIADVTEDFK